MDFDVAVLAGDGIGPEVTEAATAVLKEVGRRWGHTFDLRYGLIGGCAIDRDGTALPRETLDACRGSDAVLLGAVGGSKWDDPNAAVRPEDGLLALRKSLRLFANLRPVRAVPALEGSSPLKAEAIRGVDMIVVRELTGGLYFGRPKRRWRTSRGRRGVDTLRYTEGEVERILRVAFELARGRRKRVTSVDKANVLETSRLWREIANEVALSYPDVGLEHMLVDTAAMQVVRNPRRFDVVVTENTFGDILTDEASVLAGSMGLLPSASLAGLPSSRGRTGLRARRSPGLYEPIHGSAPDIAGRGIANPIGAILSAALMLRYSFGLGTEAAAVERAVEETLEAGLRTPDIAAPGERAIGTAEMSAAVTQRL